MHRFVTITALCLLIGLSQASGQSIGGDVSNTVRDFFPENSLADAYVTPDSTVHVTLRYYSVIMNAMYVFSPSGCVVAHDLFGALLHSVPEVFASVPYAQAVEIRCIQTPDDENGGPTFTRCWFLIRRDSLKSQLFKNATSILPSLSRTCKGKDEILKVFSSYYLDNRTQRDLMQ